ncbi:MAG: MATE family efflux transporter [Melioribacteraceae bacterium]|nr:MATE family efflux transporter [Melioribacteraceae bacterium]
MNKQILRLAIPNIISNLSIPLLSAVDTAVVGHLDETYYLGAIAIGAMIFNFLYWGFGFLRMGTTGLTAQAYGEKNNRKISLIFARALSVSIISGILIISLQILIKMLSFKIVDASSEVELHASVYFDIRIWAAPATLSLYAIHGWFLGMQNAKYPLILSVFANVCNIILNLAFIYIMGMKSDGVALGTVISQYLGLLLGLFLILKKYSSFIIKFDISEVLHLKELKIFFSVNADIFIRTLCLIFAFTYFTAKSATMGDDILAVNTILLQLWLILSYGVDGFAFAAESLVGKFIGAKDQKNLKLVIKYSFNRAMVLGVILSVVYFLFDREILSVFTNKEELISAALVFFGWTVAAPIINSFCFIWDGIYIGAMATKPMRNSMIFSSFVIYLPVILLTEPYIGNHSIWLGLLLFMFFRGLTLTLYSRKNIMNVISV